MIEGDINEKVFLFNKHAYSYTTKYLNCEAKFKPDKIDQIIKTESALRDLMSESIIHSDPESLEKEFQDSFMYSKFNQMLSEADYLIKVPMYLFDWYAYC